MSRNDGWISANGCAAKFALQAFAHRPAPQSGTQAGRLCYLGLGVMPPVGCRVVSRRVRYDRAQLIPEVFLVEMCTVFLKEG